MKIVAKSMVGAVSLAISAFAAASQFYLFPIKEIEGLVAAGPGTSRTLVDPRFVKLLFSEADGQAAQRSVVEHFVANLSSAYPASVIHAKQVNDVNIGNGHKFVNDNDLACKQVPSYNVVDTYAVIVGITRASIYEVTKGDNVEVLIPVTLNLQFIKPNLAKIVYTMSETLYSPFRFSKNEYASGAADAVIRKVMVNNIQAQVSSLVTSAKNAFNPKDVSIKLVGKDGKFFVADGGFEAGFVKGEQFEATDSNGKESVFTALYVDSGYAVLSLAAGSASVGDNLQFTFEKSTDDSRKPRIMPVVSMRPEDSWVSSIADLFSKDIGFNAAFQLSPVDVNFVQTKELMTRAANCVTWQKIQSMGETSGERGDPPNFFVRFTPTVTPVSLLIGSGGTKTSELFHSLVTAQIIDQFGKVIFSDLGDDDYAIERVNGEGLNFAQAREISIKNATQKLAKNIIGNVRFEPKDYKIVKVEKDKLWVEGLRGLTRSDRISFDVLHPLSVQIRGKTTVVDLDVNLGASEISEDGDLVGLPFSTTNPGLPKPTRGDLIRMYSQSAPGVTNIKDCSDPIYIGQNNIIEVDYLAPLIRHAIYRSNKFTSYIGDAAFYSDANDLLRQGLFSLQLKPPSEIELCSQPGYAIREEKVQCENPQNCKATVVMGMVARLKKGGEVQKTFTSGLRSEFGGFPSSGKNTFYGYKELSNGLSMQSELINKMNVN